MKKFTLLFLFLYSFNAFAQNLRKIDSVYYLVDTTKTSLNDRMWDIGFEGKFKYYTILCPCLQNDRQPTFFYRVNFEGQIIAHEIDLKPMRSISLADLIL